MTGAGTQSTLSGKNKTNSIEKHNSYIFVVGVCLDILRCQGTGCHARYRLLPAALGERCSSDSA